jgi:Protein of unknown function (DUF3297)
MTDTSATPENPAIDPVSTSSTPQAAAPAGNDTPPDRLAINPGSPHFDMDKLSRGIGIRFKGVVRNNVEEYCISEGWVRVQAGKAMDRKGNPLTIKLNGPVEAWYEDLGENAPVAKA